MAFLLYFFVFKKKHQHQAVLFSIAGLSHLLYVPLGTPYPPVPELVSEHQWAASVHLHTWSTFLVYSKTCTVQWLLLHNYWINLSGLCFKKYFFQIKNIEQSIFLFSCKRTTLTELLWYTLLYSLCLAFALTLYLRAAQNLDKVAVAENSPLKPKYVGAGGWQHAVTNWEERWKLLILHVEWWW